MRTLIVEDVALNRKVLEQYLSRHGECVAVDNGEDGLKEYMTALESDNPFHLVCLDIILPGKNGLEILRKMREIGTSIDKTKVLITSSLNDEATHKRAEKYGCDGYLNKPFTEDELNQYLLKLDLLSGQTK